jgi:hypothetical protein
MRYRFSILSIDNMCESPYGISISSFPSFDKSHIGDREMTRYLQQTAAAVAAVLLSFGTLALAATLPHVGAVTVTLPVVA